MVQSNIPFSYCVPGQDEQKLIERMHNGFVNFNNLFAGINIEKAEAFKETDQNAILELMKEVGIVTVNDIVMKSLEGVVGAGGHESEESASENTIQMQLALNARAALHNALVSWVLT